MKIFSFELMLVFVFIILTTIMLAFWHNSRKNKSNNTPNDYITKMLNRQIPYEKTILNCSFLITNKNAYPPGSLAEMFAKYLIRNNLFEGKEVAHFEYGCLALGTLAAKNGALKVVGILAHTDALDCATKNIINNSVENIVSLVQCANLNIFVSEYPNERFDLILGGLPWDSISQSDFQALPEERQVLSSAFYDIDDTTTKSFLEQSQKLLKPGGNVFITASDKSFARLERLCDVCRVKYQIVDQADLHHDGNKQYIVLITSS